MDDDQKRSEDLKRQIIKRSSNVDFVHHKWFIPYHLEIVEAIALELCGIYTQADRFKVLVTAWLHDYEKIIDFDNQYNTELIATAGLMKYIGFAENFIQNVCNDINFINAKDNISAASIEIQIVSSADAASHFVGPFGSLYWYENPRLSIDQIQKERLRKITVDWENKITLPEIKKAFLDRNNFARESAGQLPKRYLS